MSGHAIRDDDLFIQKLTYRTAFIMVMSGGVYIKDYFTAHLLKTIVYFFK